MALITIVTKQAPTDKGKNSLENFTNFGYKCVCLNALKVMAEGSHRGPPHI